MATDSAVTSVIRMLPGPALRLPDHSEDAPTPLYGCPQACRLGLTAVKRPTAAA